MALLERLKAQEREKALQRLSVPPSAKREILEGIEQSNKILSRLHVTYRSEKKIYYAFHSLGIPTILFTIAQAKDERHKKAISWYLTTLRNIKPSLKGKDLKAMGYTPGPLFNRVLKAVLDARLEGKLRSREEEIQFIKEKFPSKKKSA
jgi:tRNA nucleotidyltransferase (CCA-adding enzyme)